MIFGKRSNPCSDCWDGYCTMNCGPCIPRAASSEDTMNRRNFIAGTGAVAAVATLPRVSSASTYTSPLSDMTAFNALNAEMMHISVVAVS